MQQIKETLPIFVKRHLYNGLILLFVIAICAVVYTFRTAFISRTSKLAGIGWIATSQPLLTNRSSSQADSFYQPLVLCYHQVRDWKATDSKSDRAYIMPVNTFNEHMKALYESGYRTLLPDQWMDYMKRGERLPGKYFILTFDDGTRGSIRMHYPY
ncbi:hypothetical protein [Niabella hibiscisoli]|uniref:hypothetical protein n=1 Tax=Niabella hibiscisoli TaxID=1825928 RepID=UPI001F0E4B9D|nr:hypothetical protein [Niabella hibiscisoli]MCH5720826.1 hypothetical protein [Niabella hibiscisoli]